MQQFNSRTGSERSQLEAIIQEIQLNFLESLGLAWWIEITTKNPACVYYFGPFVSHHEARSQLDGYLEDLIQEGAMAGKTHLN
jgi:hypothetical protein